MDHFHLDTLVFYQVLNQLRRLEWRMEEDLEEMQRALRRLYLAWEGPSALDFEARARVLMRRMEALVEEYQTLVRLAADKLRQWEDLDRSWSHFWRARTRG